MPVDYTGVGGGSSMTLTVAELIAALQAFPPETPVLTEGCDCIGAATSVTLIPADEFSHAPAYLLIER